MIISNIPHRLTAEQCFESGLPFRKRDFDTFNTMNKTIVLRNSQNFAGGRGGWVLSFLPGEGVVSSGVLDCVCNDTGIRFHLAFLIFFYFFLIQNKKKSVGSESGFVDLFF